MQILGRLFWECWLLVHATSYSPQSHHDNNFIQERDTVSSLPGKRCFLALSPLHLLWHFFTRLRCYREKGSRANTAQSPGYIHNFSRYADKCQLIPVWFSVVRLYILLSRKNTRKYFPMGSVWKVNILLITALLSSLIFLCYFKTLLVQTRMWRKNA